MSMEARRSQLPLYQLCPQESMHVPRAPGTLDDIRCRLQRGYGRICRRLRQKVDTKKNDAKHLKRAEDLRSAFNAFRVNSINIMRCPHAHDIVFDEKFPRQLVSRVRRNAISPISP